jgi:hypothetical protein
VILVGFEKRGTARSTRRKAGATGMFPSPAAASSAREACGIRDAAGAGSPSPRRTRPAEIPPARAAIAAVTTIQLVRFTPAMLGRTNERTVKPNR